MRQVWRSLGQHLCGRQDFQAEVEGVASGGTQNADERLLRASEGGGSSQAGGEGTFVVHDSAGDISLMAKVGDGSCVSAACQTKSSFTEDFNVRPPYNHPLEDWKHSPRFLLRELK
jgi:hypothetical protein